MGVPGSANFFLAGSVAGYQIERSLRFNSADSANLDRAFSVAGNRRTWTWSGWVKRCSFGADQTLFTNNEVSNFSALRFRSSEKIEFAIGEGSNVIAQTTELFRDPSAWYHIIFVCDTTNANSSDRMIVYVNNTRQTLNSVSNYPPSQNYDGGINRALTHRIGRSSAYGDNLGAYMTEVYFIDGQALTPSSFGETDTITGVWKPKRYSGTYGTNGFYLPFSENATLARLGYDQSDSSASAKLSPSVLAGTYTNSSYFLDGNTANNATSSPYNVNNYGGISFASATELKAIRFLNAAGNFSTDNAGNANTYKLYAKNGAPSNGTDGTLLQTISSITGLGSVLFDSFTSGSYTHYWLNMDITATTIYIAEIQYSLTTKCNHWLTNNFSVTAGAGNDSLIDTPTPYADGGNGRGNYCTWNPLSLGTDGTLSDGNLQIAYGGATTRNATMATMGMTSGKWYWEITLTASSLAATACTIGITNVSSSSAVSNYPGFSANGWGYEGNTGSIYNNGSGTSYGATFAVNDVIGVAFDATNGKIWFSKNGTFQASGDPAAGTNAAFSSLATNTYYPAIGDGSAANTFTAVANFGQRAFAYTPPSGFLALNTQNLPEPSIKKPSSYMDVVTWTGNATYPRAITGLNFSPDLLWIKSRSNAYDNVLMDAVRGTGNTKWLTSNGTDAEGSNSSNANVTSLDSGGFTIGTNVAGINILNNSGVTNVAWCWDESATPGFDIVTYTGNGTAGRTVSHNLGVTPSMVIIKSRSLGTNWYVWHQKLTQPDYQLYLNLTDAQDNFGITALNDKAPTSTVFELPGTGYGSNNTSETYVAYLWSEVAGMSKFGSYTGNGSTDGPFVFCGFKPRWLMIKRSDSIESWLMFDTARETYNPTDDVLWANLSNAESANYTPQDFTSNGFKIRTSSTSTNASGGTYIFAAFAESPFKYALAR